MATRRANGHRRGVSRRTAGRDLLAGLGLAAAPTRTRGPAGWADGGQHRVRTPDARRRAGGPRRWPDRLAPRPAPVPVAEAYTAAWNAHDLAGRAGALRPRRRGARAPGGGAARRVGHPRPAGGARLPGGRPRRRRLRPRPPRLGDRPPGRSRRGRRRASRSTTASRRARPAPPGTRWAGRTGSSSTPSSSCRASARPRATRRRWCAAAGSRCSPWSSRPRPCSGSGVRWTPPAPGRWRPAAPRRSGTGRASRSAGHRAARRRTRPVGWPLALGGLALLAAPEVLVPCPAPATAAHRRPGGPEPPAGLPGPAACGPATGAKAPPCCSQRRSRAGRSPPARAHGRPGGPRPRSCSTWRTAATARSRGRLDGRTGRARRAGPGRAGAVAGGAGAAGAPAGAVGRGRGGADALAPGPAGGETGRCARSRTPAPSTWPGTGEAPRRCVYRVVSAGPGPRPPPAGPDRPARWRCPGNAPGVRAARRWSPAWRWRGAPPARRPPTWRCGTRGTPSTAAGWRRGAGCSPWTRGAGGSRPSPLRPASAWGVTLGATPEGARRRLYTAVAGPTPGGRGGGPRGAVRRRRGVAPGGGGPGRRWRRRRSTPAVPAVRPGRGAGRPGRLRPRRPPGPAVGRRTAAGGPRHRDLSAPSRVPGAGLGAPAVAHDRLYVPVTDSDAVWVGDRAGRPQLRCVAVGRRPRVRGIATLGRRGRRRARSRLGAARRGPRPSDERPTRRASAGRGRAARGADARRRGAREPRRPRRDAGGRSRRPLHAAERRRRGRPAAAGPAAQSGAVPPVPPPTRAPPGPRRPPGSGGRSGRPRRGLQHHLECPRHPSGHGPAGRPPHRRAGRPGRHGLRSAPRHGGHVRGAPAAGRRRRRGRPVCQAVVLTGREAVRQWITALFALRHHVEAPFQVAADRVTWRYRAYADPYEQTPGGGPAAPPCGAPHSRAEEVPLERSSLPSPPDRPDRGPLAWRWRRCGRCCGAKPPRARPARGPGPRANVAPSAERCGGRAVTSPVPSWRPARRRRGSRALPTRRGAG